MLVEKEKQEAEENISKGRDSVGRGNNFSSLPLSMKSGNLVMEKLDYKNTLSNQREMVSEEEVQYEEEMLF